MILLILLQAVVSIKLAIALLGIAVVLILIFGFLGPIGWLELFADIIDGLSDIDWFD